MPSVAGMHDLVQDPWRGGEQLAQRADQRHRGGLRALDFSNCAVPTMSMGGSQHILPSPPPPPPPAVVEAQFLAQFLLEASRLQVSHETSVLHAAGGFACLPDSLSFASRSGYSRTDPRLMSRSESAQTSCSSSSSSSSSSTSSSSLSPGNSPNAPKGSSKGERYKTELCRPFEDSGACKYGDKCQFAHGAAELRVLSRHPKYKTDKCRTFYTTGFCPYGQRCHFIHTLKPDPPMSFGSGWMNEEEEENESNATDDYQIWARSTRLQQANFSAQQNYPQQQQQRGDVYQYQGFNCQPTAGRPVDDVSVTSSLDERQGLDQLIAMLSMLGPVPQTPCGVEASAQRVRPASLVPTQGLWSPEGSTTVSSPTKSSVWSSSPAPSPTEGLLGRACDVIGRQAIGGGVMTPWW